MNINNNNDDMDVFNSEKLLGYLKEGSQKIYNRINQNDIVLVLGNTGSGKHKFH